MKLNLGCGTQIKEGYVNLDIIKSPNVDVVHNLDKYPYPFKENQFDEILCKHVLGTLEDILKVLNELHRISKKGALIKILVPYYNSKGAFNDFTYKHYFNSDSFDLILGQSAISHYMNKEFKIKRKKLIPTRFGKIFPKFIREKVSLVLGEVIASIYIELEVVK